MAGRPAGVPPIPRSPPNPAAGEALRGHRPTIVYLRRRRKGEGAVPARERGRALSGLVRERWADRSRGAAPAQCASSARPRPPHKSDVLPGCRHPALRARPIRARGGANAASAPSPCSALQRPRSAFPARARGCALGASFSPGSGRLRHPNLSAKAGHLGGLVCHLVAPSPGSSPGGSAPGIVVHPTDLGAPPLAWRGESRGGSGLPRI